MDFSIETALSNLHCVTPTDPSGEDEPYMWVYFIKIDGTTVRQRAGNQFGLSATISVQSGSGRPGNLSEAKAVSGSNIRIPGSVGQLNGSLKPIVLNLSQGPLSARIFVPGTIVVMCTLIDEEAVPRDAMEGAFNDVKAFIQDSLNDFFNGYDLTPVIASALLSDDPVGTATAAFMASLRTFQDQLTDQASAIAKQSAEIAVMADSDWWNPVDIVGTVAAGLDPDEKVGSNTFTISETDFVAASGHLDLTAALRQSSSGLGGAWYDLSGYANAFLDFAPGDHQSTIVAPVERVDLAGDGTHVVEVGRRCLDAGTVIRFKRTGFRERHQVFVKYPFLAYRYLIDGMELSEASGSVVVPNKTVAVPEFDETQFYFLGGANAVRDVTIGYEKTRPKNDPQIEVLTLTNLPDDANYDAVLTILGVFPNGQTVPVGTETITMTGQAIDFPDGFLDGYIACMAAYLKSLNIQVKATIPDDFRTPEIKWRKYQELVSQLDTLKLSNRLDDRGVRAATTLFADRLQLFVDVE